MNMDKAIRFLFAVTVVLAASLAHAHAGKINCQVVAADEKLKELRVECPEKAVYSRVRVAWLLTGEFDNAVTVGQVCKLSASGKDIWIEFRDNHGNIQHHKFDLRKIEVSQE